VYRSASTDSASGRVVARGFRQGFSAPAQAFKCGSLSEEKIEVAPDLAFDA
jgi:hypothetical protein